MVPEGDGAHRPLQPGECAHARQLRRVPQRDEGVGAAHREVLSRGVELDANAVAGVGLSRMRVRAVAIINIYFTLGLTWRVVINSMSG